MKDLIDHAIVAYQVVCSVVIYFFHASTSMLISSFAQGDDELADEDNYDEDEDDIPSDEE
jgi:hypothetical protein